ncbi:hypothetical protein [Dyadobacter psychrotolerans]|uniref:Uncharacterized protein n=1 Tax=Dyadobacter psychrotolerans TaxID=2541721 RepID=A0A4R5D5T9_9BACT|nr:hypothetical protein [Dyadobacter psychrotolerans]TDE08842.1 hypothetical protein E0F88_31850 [Dyadobacter psychrotolerans]
MGTKLHWIKEAFSRKIVILDGEIPVGEMWQDAMFSYDVQAKLNSIHLFYDVKGFLKRTVNIHDLKNDNKIIGVVQFHSGKKAELLLPSGEKYIWRRQNFFMKEWMLLRQNHEETQEVFHYEQLQTFFQDTGDITGSFAGENAGVLILTGLFLGNYFKRRRRRGAATGAATAS